MKKTISALICLIPLAGCVTRAELDEQRTEFYRLRQQVITAKEDAIINCDNKASCDKAFSLAKVYVQEHSDMKIQLLDDTIISTYNPINYADIGMSAIKAPGRENSSVIKLSATCKGMDDVGHFGFACAYNLLKIYSGFKQYVDERL